MSEIVAVIETNKGTIRMNLFAEDTPYTVANLVNLANRQYYKGLKFHRVIGDFMIQGGCPHGSGTGGPGYKFADEFVKGLRHDKPGIFSMANAGPGTNGSQFFITHTPTPHLNGRHSVFGEVATDADMAVVNDIRQGDEIVNMTIEGDTAALLEKTADKVAEWNKAIDASFPDLPKA